MVYLKLEQSSNSNEQPEFSSSGSPLKTQSLKCFIKIVYYTPTSSSCSSTKGKKTEPPTYKFHVVLDEISLQPTIKVKKQP